MKPPLHLLLASAAVACLTFVGVWLAHRDMGGPASGNETTQVPRAKSSKRVIRAAEATPPSAPSTTNPVAPSPPQPAATNVQSLRGTETAQSNYPLPAIQPAGSNPAPAVPEIVPPSHLKWNKDLAARAAIVETEANRELERLVPLLNLTPHQQDRVFAKLVENSPYWQPGIAAAVSTGGNEQKDTTQTAGKDTTQKETGGKPNNLASTTHPTVSPPSTPTPTAALAPVQSIPDLLTNTSDPILTPEQEADLFTNHLDQQEWWTELVANLETDILPDTTTTGTTPEPTDEVPDLIIEGPTELQD